MTIEVIDVEPDEQKRGGFCCLPNSSQCQRTTIILIIVTFMFFFILGCGYISLLFAHHIMSYFQLKRDILIPLEWPIRGIERSVLCIVERMIMEPDTEKCFLEVQNIPAKLERHPTRTGFVNIFRKVSHKEIEDAFRCDVASPKDDSSVKIDIASGSQSCSELSVADAKKTLPKTKISYVGVMPPSSKLASEKVIIFFLVIIIVSGSIVSLFSMYLAFAF